MAEAVAIRRKAGLPIADTWATMGDIFERRTSRGQWATSLLTSVEQAVIYPWLGREGR